MVDAEDGHTTGRSSLSYSQSSSSATTPAHSKTTKVSNKVTERHFTPRTRRLAVASKSHIRTRIVYHESGPFNPMSTRVSRLEFAWSTVREVADNSNDSQIKNAFNRALMNDRTKKNLVTFVSLCQVMVAKLMHLQTLYGRTQFISSLITKARDKVRGFYHLMGSADQVRENVKWLLTQSRFMYDDIDLEVRIGVLLGKFINLSL